MGFLQFTYSMYLKTMKPAGYMQWKRTESGDLELFLKKEKADKWTHFTEYLDNPPKDLYSKGLRTFIMLLNQNWEALKLDDA